MTWRCPSCGPLEATPLHGADNEHHCTGIDCDAVVEWVHLPEEPKKARGFTFDPTPKKKKPTTEEDKQQTREGRAILARMRKRNRGPMAYPSITCAQCKNSFDRSGAGQVNRTRCYTCAPRPSTKTPKPEVKLVERICALKECTETLSRDKRQRYCIPRHKIKDNNRKTAERKKAKRQAEPKSPRKLELATAWLKGALEKHGRISANEATQAGIDLGHSKTTIHGATKILNVQRENTDGEWWWTLPPDSSAPPHAADVQAVDAAERPLRDIVIDRASRWLRRVADRLAARARA